LARTPIHRAFRSSGSTLLSSSKVALGSSPDLRIHPGADKHIRSTERDGHLASTDDVFLTAGPDAGVSLLIEMLINSPKAKILIPIPQYPLYTAALSRNSGVPLPYYLDESARWATVPSEIERALEKARKDEYEAKALIVINPGNPTGALLDAELMKLLIRLCETHNIVLVADEVYRANLHEPSMHSFISFKKTVRDLGSCVPLLTFHSISEGVTGECGRRG
jgi:alanine transaminase